MTTSDKKMQVLEMRLAAIHKNIVAIREDLATSSCPEERAECMTQLAAYKTLRAKVQAEIDGEVV